MTSVDCFGLPLSGLPKSGSVDPAPKTVAADLATDWDAVVRAALAHDAVTADLIAGLLKQAPLFALGHAVHGLFCMMLGRRETDAMAVDDLAKAQGAAQVIGVTAREQAYIAALEDYILGRQWVVAERMDAILRMHPEDALALKIGHSVRFILGDSAGMRRSIEAVIDAYGPDHPACGYVYGCYAFALEETGAYDKAMAMGQKGLALVANDAWGLHALAHVHDMTGRPEDGVAWLTPRSAQWAHCNNFRFHVWWHLALFHLALGEIDQVLELYDREVRSEHTDDYRDISNGVTMLARLEMEGVDVGDRWEELAALSCNRIQDGCVVFADVHYAMALVGAGGRENTQAAQALLARMKGDAIADGSALRRDQGMIAAKIGLPVTEGLVAFFDRRWAEAHDHFSSVRSDLIKIGGSHAQRDIFEWLTIDAAMRAERVETAASLIRDRARRRGARDRYTEKREAAANQALLAAQ
ncbi:MAG: tetratricopeptide repeat protein [Rhodospirillaceae bacterium]